MCYSHLEMLALMRSRRLYTILYFKITFVVIARANRTNKQRALKLSIPLALS
jgi:hypothetical protein